MTTLKVAVFTTFFAALVLFGCAVAFNAASIMPETIEGKI